MSSDGAGSGSTLLAINSLLNRDASERNADPADLLDLNPASQVGPASIGVPKRATQNVPATVAPEPKKNEADIWDVDEVPARSTAFSYDEFDKRPAPKHEVLLQQRVTSSDVYLGLNGGANSASNCQDMVIKVELPDADAASFELDVTDSFVDLRTPKYKLGLHLPHKITSEEAKAEWVVDKSLLRITAPVVREYDFMR